MTWVQFGKLILCYGFRLLLCFAATHLDPANLSTQRVSSRLDANELVLRRMNIAKWHNFPSGNEKITSGNGAFVVPSLP
jgi:hypothetical protein